MRSDRSNRYTAVPQAVSDEDEGVYDESPENSQHAELLSMENLSTVADSMVAEDGSAQSEVRTMEFYRPSSHKPQLPLALVDVATLKRRPKMSCSRKFCFVLSICISIIYIVALLWLIPCHVAPCMAPRTNHHTLPLHFEEWNQTFTNLRFISDPQPVRVGSDGKAVLLLAFRLIDPNASVTNVVGKSTDETIGGVIAIEGDSGNESWRHCFYTDVLGIVCNVTDVDQNGIFECVIVGSTGLLAAINASNGHIFWYLHDHSDQFIQIVAVSAPCPLPGVDFDQDGVDDLAVIRLLTFDVHRKRRLARSTQEQYVNEQVFHLLLVSGGTGQVIGHPVTLPIAPPAHSYFHGYNRLPALILYELENNSKSLLVVWGNGDGNLSDLHNDQGIILMVSLEQVYANATKYSLGDNMVDAVDVVYKDVYRAGNLQFVAILKNDIAQSRDLIVLGSNGEELVCLSGPNEFLPKWVYRVESGFKISTPVFGSYSKDEVLDVFVTVPCINSSAKADDCSSKAVLIDGEDGQELLSSLTACMTLKPYVLFGTRANTSDAFLFEKVAVIDDRGSNWITEKMQSSEALVANFDYNSRNISAAFVRFDAYPTTRETENNVWNDIRNYGTRNSFKVPLNDSLLGEIERMEMDNMHTLNTTAAAVVSEDQYSAETSVSTVYFLTLSWLHSQISPQEIKLHQVERCCGYAKTPLLDTFIQGKGVDHPYFLSIEENSTGSMVLCFNLETRLHSKTKAATKTPPSTAD